MWMATRGELARHVNTSVRCQSDARRGGSASGSQRSLSKGSSGGMACNPARGRRSLSGPGIARDSVLASACPNRGATPFLLER